MSKPTSPASQPTDHKQIGLRVRGDLHRQLEAIAARESNGIAAVCRRLIRHALRDEPQPHPDGEVTS